MFEEGDDFYKKHSLLGHSILPTCFCIFMKNPDEHRLHKILIEPNPCISITDRALVALRSRKGVIDFKDGIIIHKGMFDPVRIFSHLIKNSSWVLSGEFQSSIEKAINIIYSTSGCDDLNELIDKAMNIFSNNEFYSYDEQFNIIFELLTRVEIWLQEIAEC